MERFWRSLKHECFLLHDFESMEEAAEVCGKWIKYYNEERPHQELGNLSPDEWLAEQLKSPFIGEGAVREERQRHLPLREPPRSARKLSEREAKKRLDTDDRKCNNTFSPVSLTKKGLLGVEKGIPPYC